MHATPFVRVSARSLLAGLTMCAAAAVIASPARAQEGDARELRRILHLKSGQTIRVLSRWKDDRWEYRGKEGWKDLLPGFVASADLESDVLNTWNKNKAGVARKDIAARTRLADWALSAGLAVEGLDEMTAVLALDPDRREALDSLAFHADVMKVPSLDVPAEGLPEAKRSLLRFGASVPGAARELAVLELGKLPHDEALRADLLAELRSSIVSRRGFGALALRRLLPSQAIKPLILHAVLDPSDEVRRASSLALRAADEPGLIVPLVRVLEKSESAELRRNAAEALGDMGYKAAVEPLVARLASAAAEAGSTSRIPHSNIFVGRQIAYIQDFNVQVAQFQAVADPEVGVLIEGGVLDAAVAGVQDVDVAVEVASVRGSLERLTGASPGKTSKAWLAWWEANGTKWRSEDLSRPPRTGSDAPAGG
jgi:hypothetical protein